MLNCRGHLQEQVVQEVMQVPTTSFSYTVFMLCDI